MNSPSNEYCIQVADARCPVPVLLQRNNPPSLHRQAAPPIRMNSSPKSELSTAPELRLRPSHLVLGVMEAL